MSMQPLQLTRQRGNAACIVHISDTHLLRDPNARFVGMNPEQSFHAVMQQVVATHSHIDAIIHTGDLAQEACPETYARYLAYMQQFGIPFFQVPGNHDHQDVFPFSQSAPQQPLLLYIGAWQIILLNSAVAGRVDGALSVQQLDALAQLLQQHQRPTLIACHHHPMLMQSYWIDQHRLKNNSDLFAVLQQAPHVKALICGHVHQDSAQQFQQIQCWSTPSTCVQFKPHAQDFSLDHRAAGYRIIQLYDNADFDAQVLRLANLPEGLQHNSLGYS